MRHWILIASCLLSSLLFAGSSPAGKGHSKAAWLWTDGERVTARLDTAGQASRVDAFMTSREAMSSAGRIRPASASQQPAARPVDVILGSANPELLMPFEIFGIFVRAAYGNEDDVARRARSDAELKAAALGLPPDFMTTLGRESMELIRAERDYSDLETRYANRGPTTIGEAAARQKTFEARACPLRAQAIKRLRSIYGVRFDQLLYTAIAPGVFKQLDVRETETELRSKSEGLPRNETLNYTNTTFRRN